ncbi:MAG: FkbM family methyltransferase [Candidatus Paceibacterota bacterium]
MDKTTREHIIDTITSRERLRPMGRIERVIKGPLRTLPYYALATLGHIRPFRMRFPTLWGTRMTSYLPEGNTFLYYGYCEANLANFFLRYIREDMICIDIGAHVGYYSMLFSELVGANGNVHSFEPTPWTFTILTENTKELKNVTINNLAVSDTEAVLEFADYGPGYGAYNTAHADGAAGLGGHAAHATQVRSVTLDSYCSKANIHPDVIKIDAEGFEFHILSGMRAMLALGNLARPVLTLEVAGGQSWKENREQSLDFLSNHAYVAYEITTAGLLTPHTAKEQYTYDNLLFVPNERTAEFSSLFTPSL